ncbi:MAG: energy transducer TonB [Bacteroidota bacterium]
MKKFVLPALLLLPILIMSVQYIHKVPPKKSIIPASDYPHDIRLDDLIFGCIPDTSLEVFKVVEDMPRFPGCEDILDVNDKRACALEKFTDYIYSNQLYPREAFERKIEGTIVIRFIVEKDGCISNPLILREIGGGCGREGLRIVQQMNRDQLRWSPGKQREKPVRIYFNLPIKFRLTDSTRVAGDGIYVENCDSLTGGMQKDFSISRLNIYPNPTQDWLSVEFTSEQNCRGSYRILEMSGQQRYSIPINIGMGRNKIKIAVDRIGRGYKIIALYDADKKLMGAYKVLIQ